MKAVPWIIFGTLGLVASFLVLLLPEMCSKALPDTLEDAECFESRKTPLKSKELTTPGNDGGQGGAVNTAPPPQDYRAYIEAIIDEQDGVKEGLEKRWYHSNYSRKSARVVRFYGLDTSPHEDPCQEVKMDKKQGIRMVRFSFENEEFRIDPWSPMRVRRFSVITEEPELETEESESQNRNADAGGGGGLQQQQLQDTTPSNAAVPSTGVENASRFTVECIDEGGGGANGERQIRVTNRFVVQRVEEEENRGSGVQAPQQKGEGRSRFRVQRVAEDAPLSKTPVVVVVPVNSNRPRFVVQRVNDDTLDLENLNNNNNNNNFNNNEKFIADKKLRLSLGNEGCENIHNLLKTDCGSVSTVTGHAGQGKQIAGSTDGVAVSIEIAPTS